MTAPKHPHNQNPGEGSRYRAPGSVPRKITVIPGGGGEERDPANPGKKPITFHRPDLLSDPAAGTTGRQHLETDPDIVHFPGESLQGARVRVSVSMSPQMHDAIQAVVESPILPWMTSSEFVRYATMLLLEDLHRIPEGRKITTKLAVLKDIAQATRALHTNREMEAVFSALMDEVQANLQAGDLIAAKVGIIDVESRLRAYPQLANYTFGRQILERTHQIKQAIMIQEGDELPQPRNLYGVPNPGTGGRKKKLKPEPEVEPEPESDSEFGSDF